MSLRSDSGFVSSPPLDWEQAERFRSCTAADRADAIDQLVALRAATEQELLALIEASFLEGDHLDDGLPDRRVWVAHRLRVGYSSAGRVVTAVDKLPELPALRETLAGGALVVGAVRCCLGLRVR